jgi:hypothetical protein
MFWWREMIPWGKLKRVGVYLFFLGLGIWFLSELLIIDRELGRIAFIGGWLLAIVGAVVNGIAVVKERFFSD